MSDTTTDTAADPADDLAVTCRLLAAIDPNSDDLDAWQKQFITDQQQRFEKYGDTIRLSDKQAGAIRKIAAHVGVN